MMDDDSLRARLEENYALLEAFAQSWQAVASEDYPELARFVPAKGESPTLNLDPVRLTPRACRLRFHVSPRDAETRRILCED